MPAAVASAPAGGIPPVVASAPATANPSPPAAVAPKPPAGQGALTITNNDLGKTLHARVGAAVLVELTYGSGNQPWAIEAPNPAVLAPTSAPAAAPGTTAQGYRAAAPGTATIQATDRPACAPAQPCPRFIQAFRATVVVDPA